MACRFFGKAVNLSTAQVFASVNFRIFTLSTGLNSGLSNYDSERVSYCIIKLLPTAGAAGTLLILLPVLSLGSSYVLIFFLGDSVVVWWGFKGYVK